MTSEQTRYTQTFRNENIGLLNYYNKGINKSVKIINDTIIQIIKLTKHQFILMDQIYFIKVNIQMINILFLNMILLKIYVFIIMLNL